jgi:hypothetical protein
MNPATIIAQATAEGVKLVLSATDSIKATGNRAAVNRWLPVIREHKLEIIKMLKASDGDQRSALQTSENVTKAASQTHFAWRVRFTDRNPLTVTFSPEVTHAEALACYTDAVSVEKIEKPEI